MPAKRKTLFFVLFLLLIFFMFIRIYKVSDISMNYSLMDGDLVIAENLTAGVHTPSLFSYVKGHLMSREQGIRRGDLMTFKHPLDDRLYLKRVVALPGDRIFQEEKNFYLQIDANRTKTIDFARRYRIGLEKKAQEYWLKNPYTRFYHISHSDEVCGPEMLIDYPVTVIPEHHYFFMGDFRDNSTDSRFFGPVQYDNIYYKIRIIISRSQYLEERADVKQY
jgi:signal peptidase I